MPLDAPYETAKVMIGFFEGTVKGKFELKSRKEQLLRKDEASVDLDDPRYKQTFMIVSTIIGILCLFSLLFQ